MKRFSILLLLILSISSLFAQENVKYVYCEIHTYIKGMGGKQGAIIEFGSKSELKNDKIYLDEAGQPIKFDSAIDALNFMSNNGWELAHAYVIVSPVTCYILKKKGMIITEETKQ